MDIVSVGKKVASIRVPLTTEERNDKRFAVAQMMYGVKNVVAPMVEQSELAFRMMMREHGAHLCFSPMIHAHLFVNDLTYRKTALTTCSNDRPLIVQFCANDPETLLKACCLVEEFCDCVDLNLGCPQSIAKRGHYGAFLQENIDLICEMVSLVDKHCALPLSCKIRILSDMKETLNYARALEAAGARMLTIHGRTRDQKGPNTGLANWQYIKFLKSNLNIPVIANGNIQVYADITQCLESTKADAVMSAEGILYNPYLFENRQLPNWIVATEYLNYAEQYKAPHSSIRGHVFRICHHSMLHSEEIRQNLSIAWDVERLKLVLKQVESHVNSERNNGSALKENEIPHWICQPYTRSAVIKQVSNEEYRSLKNERLNKLVAETGLSKRRLRKLEKKGPLQRVISVK